MISATLLRPLGGSAGTKEVFSFMMGTAGSVKAGDNTAAEAADTVPKTGIPGLMAACYNWVDNRPEVTPAFVAARAGYDVWCGNNRGVANSQGHTTLDADNDKEYWEFSW